MDPPATLPDWHTLRDETLRAIASRNENLRAHLDTLLQLEMLADPVKRGLPPEVVASVLSGATPKYFQSLSALDHGCFNQNHRLIARLAAAGVVRHVITTNFDRLVEHALAEEGIVGRVCRTDAEFEAYAREPEDSSAIYVFKIHGSLDLPESIIARVEDEGRGLAGPKAVVLRKLLREFVFLFWGYSGADLKVDLDYLQMVSMASEAPGFIWNLHEAPGFREPVSTYVEQLLDLYRDRGSVVWATVPQALNRRLPHQSQVPLQPGRSEEIQAQREVRTAELREALRQWADASLSPSDSLLVYGRLLRKGGEGPSSASCYFSLNEIATQAEDWITVSRAQSELGELYAETGETAVAEESLSRANDLARTYGDIAAVLKIALTGGGLKVRRGTPLPALMSYGFAELLCGSMRSDNDAARRRISMDIADVLTKLKALEPALNRYRAAEQEARDAGAKEELAEILYRLGVSDFNRGETDSGIARIREAEELATWLGLRWSRDTYRLRLETLTGARGPDADELIDQVVAASRRTGNVRVEMNALVDAVTARTEQGRLDGAEQVLSEIAEYAADFGDADLLGEVQLARVDLYGAAGDDAQLAEALETAIQAQESHGPEPLVARLAELLGDVLWSDSGREADAFQWYERAVALHRKSLTFYPDLEDKLAGARVKLGRAAYPDDWDAFCDRLVAQCPSIDADLADVAREHGVDRSRLGEWSESNLGTYGRYSGLLTFIAIRCRRRRDAGDAEQCIPVLETLRTAALDFGDLQLAATLTNERGLTLMGSGRAEEAIGEFSQAARWAAAASDLAEVFDDEYNAGGACEALGLWTEAEAHYAGAALALSARPDIRATLRLTLRTGEVLKKLGRTADALESFESAEIYARALADSNAVEQAVMRLGKLCWDLGELERSIRYRNELALACEQRGELGAAAHVWLLIANTYDERLGRPDDGLPFYRRALELTGTDEEARGVMRERLLRCDQELAERPPGMRLLELLRRHSAPADVALIASRLALATDFNLWHFEPRSFCAWYERIWKGEIPLAIESARTVPIWVLMSIYHLIQFAQSARSRGDLADAVDLLELARRVASAFDVPQGACLALRELARCREQEGNAPGAEECLQAADRLKAAFQEWATTEGIPRFATPEAELPAWSHLGVLLTQHGHELIDTTHGRIITTWGRACNMYFLLGEDAVAGQATVFAQTSLRRVSDPAC